MRIGEVLLLTIMVGGVLAQDGPAVASEPGVLDVIGAVRADRGDRARPGGEVAGGSPFLSGPCGEYEQRRLQLKAETQDRMEPVLQLINIGDRALRRRYYQEALESYTAAIDVAESLQDRWYRLAQDLIREAGTGRGVQEDCTRILSRALSEAVKLKDLLHRSYPHRGRVYFEIGNFSRAVEEIARAVQIRPDDPDLWYELGRARLEAGTFGTAVEAFHQSLRLDRYQPEVYYDLGIAYAKAQDVPRALHSLRQCISLGFRRFDEMEADEGFANLRGDAGFENLVYHGPRSLY